MANKIMGVVRTGQAQGGSLPFPEGRPSPFDSTWNGMQAEWKVYSSSPQAEPGAIDSQDLNRPVTAAEVAAIVRQVISEIQVYVLESDITDAQNAVKGMVEQTYF